MGAKPHLATADDTGLLDALPIAAAIIERSDDGSLKVMAHNSRFLETGRAFHLRRARLERRRLPEDRADRRTDAEVLRRHATSPASSTSRTAKGVSSQFFRMKLAPFPRRNGKYPRCLLSVVDRTVEVQAERTLRAEMLRDSLTGLPNRLAFSEAIEKAGENVARDLEHAVLVVDMLRFSPINESMGSLAGDELLITFARRLILALRAGDVLARTGGNEFGVLVSLRRGVEDALKAAERIQQVMAAPFKLSELEIRVECAIGVALMHAGQDPEELFRNAQFAVKQAKVAGKPAGL